MKRNWNNIKAVVTGASRGLGLALAKEIVQRGGEVVMVARGESALQHAVGSLSPEGRAHGLVADVGAPGAATSIASRASELLGEVNLLIHNASTLGPVPLRPLADVAQEDLARVFQVNTLGPQRLTNALLGSMIAKDGATVVVISSDAAVESYPNWGAYGASKAALDHLLRVQAVELEEFGIRLLSVDPGEMDTQMHAAAIPDADRSLLGRPQAVASRIAQRLESEFTSGAREAV